MEALKRRLERASIWGGGTSTNSADDDDLISTSATPLIRARPMTIKDQLTLSPVEKLVKYRRIPFKLILNLAVVALITAYIVSDNQQYAGYVNAMSTSFRALLLNDAATITGTSEILSLQDFTDTLGNATLNYFNYPDTSPYPVSVQGSASSVLTFTNGSTWQYSLFASDPLGPFGGDLPSLKSLVYSLARLDVTYTFTTQQQPTAGSGRFATLTYIWNCNAIYDFTTGGGYIEYIIDLDSTVSNPSASELKNISIALIIVTLLSIILTVRALRNSWSVYQTAKFLLSKPAPPTHATTETVA